MKKQKRKIKSVYVMQRFVNELNFSILFLAIFKRNFQTERIKLTENFCFFQTDNPLRNQCWKTSQCWSGNLIQQRIIILQKSSNSTILLNSKMSFYICVHNRCQTYGKKKKRYLKGEWREKNYCYGLGNSFILIYFALKLQNI